MLAGAAAEKGDSANAYQYEKAADRYSAADPYFQWMIGLRLKNVGMDTLAEKHFGRAIQMDPSFHARRAQMFQ